MANVGTNLANVLGRIGAAVLASAVATQFAGAARRFLRPGATGPQPPIAAPAYRAPGQRLYPAQPLLEPQYAPYAAPLPLPGNVIVEVPTPGRVPARLDRIRDVGPYLTACWHAPAPSTDAAGASWPAPVPQVTLRTGFRRDGALIGPPRLTFSYPPLTAGGQRDFVAASILAFRRCTPLPLTTGFGRAIAGVPFAIRFTSTRR